MAIEIITEHCTACGGPLKHAGDRAFITGWQHVRVADVMRCPAYGAPIPAVNVASSVSPKPRVQRKRHYGIWKRNA